MTLTTAFLDNAVNRQAVMIAYIDDFWFILFLTLLVMQLLLLIRPRGRNAPIAEELTAVMDQGLLILRDL